MYLWALVTGIKNHPHPPPTVGVRFAVIQSTEAFLIAVSARPAKWKLNCNTVRITQSVHYFFSVVCEPSPTNLFIVHRHIIVLTNRKTQFNNGVGMTVNADSVTNYTARSACTVFPR